MTLGAECYAYCKFMFPGRRADQHEGGDVGDGEQQHQRHSPSEEPDLLPAVPTIARAAAGERDARRCPETGGPDGKDAHADVIQVARGLVERDASLSRATPL